MPGGDGPKGFNAHRCKKDQGNDTTKETIAKNSECRDKLALY